MPRKEVNRVFVALEPEFLTSRDLAVVLAVSQDTVKLWQRQHWQQGLHYVKLTEGRTGGVRYNRELCVNWLKNIHDPGAHAAFCATYLRAVSKYSPPSKAS